MANLLTVLETLNKGIKAEQRNGCTNAGVMGGFANFLLLAMDKIASHPEADLAGNKQIIERLQVLANNYMSVPPRQRVRGLQEINKSVQELKQRLETALTELNLAAAGTDVELIEKNAAKIEPNLPPTVNNKAQESQGSVSKGSRSTCSNPSSGIPIQYLKGVGPQRAKLLARLEINTIEELLNHFPRRYEDRRNVKSISQVIQGEVETVRGTVVAHQELKPRRGLKIIKLTLHDGSGSLYAVWFNNPYVLKQLPRGTQLIVTGKVDHRFGMTELAVSDYEVLTDQEFIPRIIPVYAATENLPSKQIRTLMGYALERVDELMPEILPETTLRQYGFLKREDAYRQIHFPTDFTLMEAARRRLVFEEFVLLQLGIQRLKGENLRQPGIAMDSPHTLVTEFCQRLSFHLTKAQRRVVSEVFHDMARPHPMARMVQGDVGSGKTVVAALALLKAVECGYQGAMMAPTEILAEQHYSYLREAFEPLGVRVDHLIGSMGKKEREQVLHRVANGISDILVGTHALIQENVTFKALGLAVTDEQHRFGVRQRAVLQHKGNNPHVLVMTATPIPRTLALTLYGDLNLSVIDELPPGRKEIKTFHITEKSRDKLHKFMERELASGRQIYIVCPLVEESEALDLKAATELAAVTARRFPANTVGLLHGRMRPQEKDRVIEGFRTGQIQILVSTTVVEVGVNVPNASVMVIEGAERFGLAQLHQLRGRVGRGGYQSYCILVSSAVSDDIKRRLAIMCETNDGFRIAEEDLKIRGPGEFFGTRQHGLPELKIADLIHDGAVLEQARATAELILKSPRNEAIFREVEKKFGNQTLVRG